MNQLFDLQKQIQISVWQGSHRKWYDAKVLSAWASIDDTEDENRPMLNFRCEYYTNDGTYDSQITDVLGISSDNWRYKEKCCEQCKWVDTVGGDVVPYGSTTAVIPEGYTCECPEMPEDIEIPYDETNGGRECQYHEFPTEG